MKNYLDHNDKVKYVDGLLSHSQEWQWFIDLLIKSFDIHEINSWDDYEKYLTLFEIFSTISFRSQKFQIKHGCFLKMNFMKFGKLLDIISAFKHLMLALLKLNLHLQR